VEIGVLLKPGQQVKLKSNDVAEPYSIKMCLSEKLVVCKAFKHPVPLTGESGKITIIRPASNGVFVIESKIKDSSEKGGLIALTQLGEPNFLERRSHYRLNHQDITVPLEIELRPQNNSNRYKRVKLYDISAGGIGLVVKASSSFFEGMRINIKLNLETIGLLSFVGEVAHVSALNPLSKDYLLGIKYVEFEHLSQQKIMHFIQEQVVIKQNGENKPELETEDG